MDCAHGLVELFNIVILSSIFVISLSTYGLIKNGYLMFLGIVAGFAGGFHLIYFQIINIGLSTIKFLTVGIIIINAIFAGAIFLLFRTLSYKLDQAKIELQAKTAELLDFNNQLQQSEALNKAYLANAADGIIVVDSGGFIKLSNPAAEKMFGYLPGEISNKQINILIPENFHAQHDIHLHDYLTVGKMKLTKRRLEVVGKQKDGTVFPIEATVGDIKTGDQYLYIAIVRDITERKAVERDLDLLAKVFESTLSSIAIIDQKGIIQAVNEPFIVSNGYTNKEIIGRHYGMVVSEHYTENFFRELNNQIGECGNWEGEIWGRRKNGETYPLWVSISAIRNEHGEITNYLTISRDITADIQLRQEVLLAGKIQKNFLPPDQKTKIFITKSIFKPYNLVSGDFYSYNWDSDKQILYGFVLDVMGHGLSTALQISALHVLFRQTMIKQLSLAQGLAWLNRESTTFFADGSFGAAISFSFDFSSKKLTLGSAGICYILHIHRGKPLLITVPGLFLGIKEDEVYEEKVISIEEGDGFIFLTDGLFDNLQEEDFAAMTDFSQTMEQLEKIVTKVTVKDDITALGVYLKKMAEDDGVKLS